jgi:sec-independent protein translocase protein TatA
MFGLGLPEVIIIALAVAIFFFGGKKIVELSRSMGRVSGEFKKGKMDIERELRESEGAAMHDATIEKKEVGTDGK